ncbi:MAG: Single-stranded-DNA-specific exonuclease [Candidatus Moranbacteria bacterium GW2011_GWE1_35_17]|nr:MAG: Single-stranded-DNA-specific exonuclease [Candidatus Moranbacteria bacterium GW2011_GWE1_35_17]KKP82185.1 MAG: Single-stranded-DNA-specific exonuclease [Candidatus Moranbacteria bacterium GW2011_GWF1_35_5]
MIWKLKENSDEVFEDDSSVGESLSLHPQVLKLLLQRGVRTKEEIKKFMFPNYDQDILDPFLFKDMPKAMERLKLAKEKKEKVLIFGDYDADGITSSLILKITLAEIGLEVDVFIPNKEDGYGLSDEALKNFSEKGFTLVITTDCGIANKDEVAGAKKIGMDVIVTDHHHVPPEIPLATAVINPKIKNCGYPEDNLAGVGVAFKFAQAIYETFLPNKKEATKWMLDLVAIGTIADMVPLTGENRTMTKFGLLVLSKTRRVGLQEMFKVGRILIDENNFPDARKISFQIAPRINAASRMTHAEKAFSLLAETDRVLARDMALDIEAQNSRRQKETATVVSEVEKIANNSFKDKNFILVDNENFPVGILGLVAGKMTDKFKRPVAILKKGNVESKGSFRSIPQINIIESIEVCSELLVKYGGHAQAAGITIKNENLEKFYDKMAGIIDKKLESEDLSPEIKVDLELTSQDIGLELIEDLKKMEPFGQGNELPIFMMKELIIQDLKWVGNGEKHLKLFVRPKNESPKIFEAIGFHLNEKFKDLKIGEEIKLLFNLEEDEWNGNKKIQMKIVDIKGE